MITGVVFLDAVLDACTLLQGYCETLNALDVENTGSDLLHTMTGVKALTATSADALSKVSQQVALALSEQARGKAGVWLTLLFQGMAEGFKDTFSADGGTLIKALCAVYDHACYLCPDYKADTILTVVKSAADSAKLAVPQTVQSVISAACDGALHGLRTAQMVDAVGYGYWIVLRAMAERFGGHYIMTTLQAQCTT